MSSKAKSSAAISCEDPPRLKKESPATTEPISIESLPFDLLLNCLARVSRLYYRVLSRVSKRFRSIVTSTDICNTRSLLNRTERCLYLCLRFPLDKNVNTRWFTLYQNPSRTLTKSKGNYFFQIPSPEYPLTQWSSLVAVGSNIYKIGNDFFKFGEDRYPSSSVSVLDCQSHTWRDGPSMPLDWRALTASLVDGKIYVAGGSNWIEVFDRKTQTWRSYGPNSSDWIQVFDPKTQTWGSVTNPDIKISDGSFTVKKIKLSGRSAVKSLGLEGKFYLFGDEFVVYNPEEGKWNPIGVDRDMGRAVSLSHCVIDNILFYWEKGVFKWYDCNVSCWKELKGVEGLPDFSHRQYCKLVDLGGKMAVLWDICRCSEETMIWCAEIALERRNGDEIWGKVEWLDYMVGVEASCCLYNSDVLSVSV